MSAKKCSQTGWCSGLNRLVTAGYETGGLNKRTLMSLETGKNHDHPSVVVYLRKDAREAAGGAFVRLRYCPCCGARIDFGK